MSELQQVPVEKCITDDEFNARSDLGDLTDLVASITSQGIQEPILAKAREGDTGEVEVFVGFRRLAAAKKAGLKVVPVIVHNRRSVTKKSMAIANVVENVQRNDLNVMDEAEAIQRLTTMFEMSVDDVAKELGLPKARVTQRLRLLKLSDAIKAALTQDTLTVKAALEISRLPLERQGKFVEIARELSGARLQEMVDKELAKIAKKAESEEGDGKKKDKDKPSTNVTEYVRAIRKGVGILSQNLGLSEEEQARLKDVNFRLMEEEDLRALAGFCDRLVDSVPLTADFNERAQNEIITHVENSEDLRLAIDEPVVRQALIKAIGSRAEELAREKAGPGKRVKVTYAMAQQALSEFYAPETEEE